MKGDVVVVEEYHQRAAEIIVDDLISNIKAKTRRYIITVAGESGSGKSETGKAIQDALGRHQVTAVLIGQDDYFILTPRANDARRRQDPHWLGPHVEVRLDLMEKHLIAAIEGKNAISKPLMDYVGNKITQETIDLTGVRVLIAEGTYTSLLRNVDTRVFIDRTFEDTLSHREKRNRGDEVGSLFIEKLLEDEHKIIAGHKSLADIIITKEYDVLFTKRII